MISYQQELSMKKFENDNTTYPLRFEIKLPENKAIR